MSRRRVIGHAPDRGAVAVEFALLLPMLLLIVFGIIDFGRALNAQVTLTQAAREGARVDSLGSASQVCNRTKAAAIGLNLTCANVIVTYQCQTGDGQKNLDAQVQATDSFSFVTPVGAIAGLFGGSGFGSPITLSAQGVMPCET